MMHAFLSSPRRWLYAIVTALTLMAPAAAMAQVEFSVGFPPFGFVATTPPIYYEGRPHYWYHNRWWYRDGDNWRYYREDPYYLRHYWSSHQPYRHYYGRGYGRHYYYRHRY
jgi:hypothetical protein